MPQVFFADENLRKIPVLKRLMVTAAFRLLHHTGARPRFCIIFTGPTSSAIPSTLSTRIQPVLMTQQKICKRLLLLLLFVQTAFCALAQKNFGDAGKKELPEVTWQKEEWRQQKKSDSLTDLHPLLVKDTTSANSQRRLREQFEQIAEETVAVAKELGFKILRIELYQVQQRRTKVRIVAVEPFIRKLVSKQQQAAI